MYCTKSGGRASIGRRSCDLRYGASGDASFTSFENINKYPAFYHLPVYFPARLYRRYNIPPTSQGKEFLAFHAPNITCIIMDIPLRDDQECLNTTEDDDAQSYMDEDDVREVRLHHWLSETVVGARLMQDSTLTRADSPLLGIDHPHSQIQESESGKVSVAASISCRVIHLCFSPCPTCRPPSLVFAPAPRPLPRPPPLLHRLPPPPSSRPPRPLTGDHHRSLKSHRIPNLLYLPVDLHWHDSLHFPSLPSQLQFPEARPLLPDNRLGCTQSLRLSHLARIAMPSILTRRKSARVWANG